MVEYSATISAGQTNATTQTRDVSTFSSVRSLRDNYQPLCFRGGLLLVSFWLRRARGTGAFLMDSKPTPPKRPVRRRRRVPRVLLVLPSIAILSIGLYFVYRHYATARARAFWRTSYELVENPHLVEALKLSPDNGTHSIFIADQSFRIVARRDLLSTSDFIDVRSALLHDRGFEWGSETTPDVANQTKWKYALRFTQGGARTTLLIDAYFYTAARAYGRNNRAIGIEPIAGDLRAIFNSEHGWEDGGGDSDW